MRIPCEKRTWKKDTIGTRLRSEIYLVCIDNPLGGEKNFVQYGKDTATRSRSVKIVFSGAKIFANTLCHVAICSNRLISQTPISLMNGQCDIDISLPITMDIPKGEALANFVLSSLA